MTLSQGKQIVQEHSGSLAEQARRALKDGLRDPALRDASACLRLDALLTSHCSLLTLLSFLPLLVLRSARDR